MKCRLEILDFSHYIPMNLHPAVVRLLLCCASFYTGAKLLLFAAALVAVLW